MKPRGAGIAAGIIALAGSAALGWFCASSFGGVAVTGHGRSGLDARVFSPSKSRRAAADAWLERIGTATAENFAPLAAEALQEMDCLRRQEKLEAVLARWVEVSPRDAWEWTQRKFPGGLRDRDAWEMSRDPRLTLLLDWAMLDAPSAYAALRETHPGEDEDWASTLASQWAKTNARELLDFIAAGHWGEGKDQATASALKALAAGDQGFAWQEALKLPAGHLRNSVIGEVAEQMARDDPAQALAWVKDVPRGAGAVGAAYSRIFAVMGERDPAGAARLMDEYLTGSLSMLKARAARPVLEAWMKTDPAAAVKWGVTLGPDGALSAFQGLVKPDSPEALVLTAVMKSGENRDNWENHLSEEWRDGGAQDWLQKHPAPKDDTEMLAARTAVLAWTREDVQSAAAWVNRLPDGKTQEDLRLLLLTGMARNGAPDAAVIDQLGRMTSAPDDEVVVELAAKLGAQHASQILPVITAFPAGAARDSLLSQTAGSWAERDSAAAAAWADALPSLETRTVAVDGVMEHWWPTDPEAAENWAAQQPEGTLRDIAFSRLATNMVEEAPERALEYAASISDREAQAVRMEAVLKKWAETDPAAALAALAAKPLPAVEKERLAAKLETGFQ